MEELYDLVRQIPAGRVVSYGALGNALSRPVSGFLVGRAMRSCPEGVPWWRVVSKDGFLVIHKLDPVLALRQREKLRSENTEMADDDCVSPSAFIDPLTLVCPQ
jgi:alkylated DNA nucleotide flippase Atl1